MKLDINLFGSLQNPTISPDQWLLVNVWHGGYNEGEADLYAVNLSRFALRISNVVACAILLVCGYAFGYYSGFRPWAMGLVTVGTGGVLIGVAILLGG
jgi:hypothetical protein